MQLSAADFWEYSLNCYSQVEVKQGCLLLQDEYGLNVNLLLFCRWLGEVHNRVAAKEFFINELKEFRQLEVDTLIPVRAMRRQFKKQHGDGESYQKFLSVELSLEKYAQTFIVDSAQKSSLICPSKNVESTYKNLTNYCAAEGVMMTKNISMILKEKILGC